MKSIAIFNNKGGVGKTTLLCNLASYVSQREGKRVLIVDADPQCSATIYLFSQEKLQKLYEKKEAPSIYKVVHHLQKAKGGYLKAADIPIFCDTQFKVNVLIGDTRLALAEDFLSKDWSEAINGEPRGLQTTFLFKGLLDEIKDEYDYVFFDMGPSLGAINRTVLLACDYFIMPMSSDIFCLRAIDNISLSLKDWTNKIKGGLSKYEDIEKEPYFESYSTISFLGYITQQYNARTSNGVKRPVKAYEKIIERFSREIIEKLKDFYAENNRNNLKLGEIPNWNSLVAFSQTSNKPIFDLSSANYVFGSHVQKVKEFGYIMSSISEHITNNIAENHD